MPILVRDPILSFTNAKIRKKILLITALPVYNVKSFSSVPWERVVVMILCPEKNNVVDRHRFDADPDPNFHVDADPDPDAQ